MRPQFFARRIFLSARARHALIRRQRWHPNCICVKTEGLRVTTHSEAAITNMTRLDGEKKSPLPYIIGLIVLALVAAGIYFLFVANKGADTVQATSNGIEIQNNAPGGLGVDNGADANATDTNAMDANMADANATDTNMADANATDTNTMDANMATSNTMMDNSAMGNSVMDNSAMSNSAMGGAMGNSAMSNSAMGGGAMSNSATSNSAMPAMTPAAMSGSAPKSNSDIVATRSKTIKTGDSTVTYKKSVTKDGAVMRDKTIAAEPVKAAKQ